MGPEFKSVRPREQTVAGQDRFLHCYLFKRRHLKSANHMFTCQMFFPVNLNYLNRLVKPQNCSIHIYAVCTLACCFYDFHINFLSVF